MPQRIFDVENEKDITDLWNILPDNVFKIKKEKHNCFNALMYFLDGHSIRPYLILNWHDKTEITRPIQEATEADIDKLCYFWDDDVKYPKQIGLLSEINTNNSIFKYVLANSVCFAHCRRLTKQEIEKLI